MPPLPPAPASPLDKAVLLGLLVVASVALLWILLPFYGPILWACVIAMLFVPLHRRLVARLHGRRSAAALVTLGVALVCVVLPLVALGRALAVEAVRAYEHLRLGEWRPVQLLQGVFDALPLGLRRLLGYLGLSDFGGVQRRVDAALVEIGRIAQSQAFSVGQGTLEFVAGSCVMLYLAFFMLRDGEAMVRGLQRAIPLAPGHARQLVERFATVVRATVKGHLVVAGVQGALGGLAFWALGVDSPLLWGAVMAVLSLVPVIGAALVWLPVALGFLLAGALWQGVALLVFGVMVIGLADNLLRPMLVGRDTRLPDYVVLVTTLGGIAVFGINGLLLGPAIAAMFVAVWQLEMALRQAGPEPAAIGAVADGQAAVPLAISGDALHAAADGRSRSGKDEP